GSPAQQAKATCGQVQRPVGIGAPLAHSPATDELQHWQAPAKQTRYLPSWLQQSRFSAQASSSCATQEEQTPCGSLVLFFAQIALQQSVSSVQGSPSGRHGPQLPSAQQTPSRHWPPQHWRSPGGRPRPQVFPTGRQGQRPCASHGSSLQQGSVGLHASKLPTQA